MSRCFFHGGYHGGYCDLTLDAMESFRWWKFWAWPFYFAVISPGLADGSIVPIEVRRDQNGN